MPIAVVICLIVWSILEKQQYGFILYVFAIVALISAGMFAWEAIDMKIKRRQGIYPKKGQVTEADVKRLALSGYRSLAVRARVELNYEISKRAENEVDKIIAKDSKGPTET